MLDLLRANIATHLRNTLPPMVTVMELANTADATALDRLSMASPAVSVEIVGTDGLTVKGGAPYVNVSIAVSVVCTPTLDADGTGKDATEAALALVTLVMANLADQTFGLDAGRPDSVRATNLTDGEIETDGTALWAITWKQSMDVSNVITRPDLDDFLRCFVREKTDGDPTIQIHLPGTDTAPASSAAGVATED
ncbi:hypothetical protein [Desulfovibrio sp.]|uniref:hypothetical protein n=1 Tax=Desulfovibrio sp. TaxID=885 RepID=UPI003D0EB8B7